MLEQSGEGYDLQRLRQQAAPLVVHHAVVMTSTHDRARQEVESGVLDQPALVVADTQSAGRGRGDHSWWSAPGNVMATFVLPQNRIVPCGLVPLLAGLAVRRALVQVTAFDRISLKWPNDVLIGRQKTAGLLCERLQRFDLIGIGVNVNVGSDQAPQMLRDRVTCLREATGRTWDLTEVLGAICRQLDGVFSASSLQEVCAMMEVYAAHHALTGQDIAVIDTEEPSPATGRCLGVDVDGRLMVETSQGRRWLLTGSIAPLAPGSC